MADYERIKGCAKTSPVASSQGSSAQWPWSFAECFQVGPLRNPIQTPEHLLRTAEAVDASRSRVFALGEDRIGKPHQMPSWTGCSLLLGGLLFL